MGSRDSRRFLPPLRAFAIFSLIAMETVHLPQGQFSVRTEFWAKVRFCLILNQTEPPATIWMRVKPWTGVGGGSASELSGKRRVSVMGNLQRAIQAHLEGGLF